MKKLPLLGAACGLLSPLAVFGQTILIDYDDGDSGNGIHDANINSGDIGVQDWVGSHQYQTNNNSGVGSSQNLIMGANREAAHTLETTGYSPEVGHTLTGSFMWRSAANWDAADRPVFSVFYTDDDTIDGAPTDLFSYEVATSNGTTYRVENVPAHLITDSGVTGKTLFVRLSDNDSAVGGEFYRADNVFVSVDTTVPSPFLLVDADVSLSANTTATSNFSIPISNLAGDGTTPLAISGVTPTGTDSSGVSNLVFPPTVVATASDQITFDFTPSSGAGSYTFDLEIASDDAGLASPRVVTVDVEVGASPFLVVDGIEDFVNDGSSTSYSVSVTNDSADGTTPLSITGVIASGTDSDDVSNIVFPPSVAAGASGDITFDFLPSVGGGSYSFVLEVSSDDQGASSPTEILVFVDVEDPVISLGSASLDFGDFSTPPAPQVETVTITNTGGATDLVIDEINTAITGAGAFTITSFPGPIAPGASGDLEVTFTPAAGEGLIEGTLTIVSNDFDNTQPQVSLRAFIFPSDPVAAIDFGTSGSPVAAGYTQFEVSEGASQTIAGVGVTLSSRDGNISAGSGAGSGDLFTDFAQTPFNGSAGAYISVVLTGLADGTLNLVSSHDFSSSFALPINVQFGEVGALASIANGITRPGEVAHSAVVEAGKTYELRVIESGNANLAYISGLLLWGDAVPGGTPFGSFVTDAGLDPATTGLPGLDPDLDGIDTGIEWVVGGSPNDTVNPDTTKLPTAAVLTADPDGDETVSDYLVFTYRRTTASAADTDTTIDVEYGTTLAGWNTALDGTDGVVIIETLDGFEAGVDQVDVYVPTSLGNADGRLFARLNVTIAGTEVAVD
ncbi:choice-of-anchor D domain-containing protein [Haloferula rosea]|uniref:Choice-of-anchor D domain-containing protein n=1 Tax=Haloferula rosea TaxID=490093 RepID=A0A934RA90_9BACT|nr:choice-of-anchor D domain-containing protein [Haloferula rosea]MBK1827287.1 choice-of-anchor D domain-containing protein [Haloferula rosea]